MRNVFGRLVHPLLRPACLIVALAMFATVADAQVAPGTHRLHVMHTRGASSSVRTYQQANMTYHGGTVLPDTTIYSIWWGKLGDFPPDAVDGLTTFLKGIDGSNYLGIANQYLFGSEAHARFGGNFFDRSTPETTDPFLDNGAQLSAEACKIVAAHGLKSPTDIFMIYPSNYPAPSENYCGFHGYDTCSDGTPFYYAYMPNVQGHEVCNTEDIDPFLSPNHSSVGTRNVANVTGHELLETITDPFGDAWYDDAAFNEVGDACAWSFLTWVPLEESGWKVQPIWSNQISGCAQGGNHDVRILGALTGSASTSTFDVPAAGLGTFGNSVNGLGAIAGTYIDASNIGHGFIRDPSGALATFDAPRAIYGTYSWSVNEAGAICGTFFDSNGTHGFVRDPRGNFTAFDAPGAAGGTGAAAINQSGVIAGRYVDAGGVTHGYVRDAAANFVTFDLPGVAAYLHDLNVEGINHAGDVAGYYTDARSVNHGFVRSANGLIATFDAPGGTDGTFARSINDQGAITGYFTDAKNLNHGFIRSAQGQFTTFDAPGAVYGTEAHSINATGEVAGAYSDTNANSRGFIRDAQGNFTTFDGPANSINADGETAGYSIVPIP